ncbi:MAG: HAMP domain-containing sensor histidine kinase [Romboutsia sp.]
MINLYNNIEIIRIINVIIICSSLFMSIVLLKVSKDKSYLALLLIYIVEISLNIFLIKYNYEDIAIKYKLYLTSLIYIIKPILYILFSKYLKFSISLNVLIVGGNLLSILLIQFYYEISLVLNIVINILIIDKGIVDKIKSLSEELHKNIHKLKVNKKYISKAIDLIAKEYELQNKYKNEISKLNEKVTRSIEEVTTPVFVLNKDKEYIYGNKCFEELIESENKTKTNINIYDYFEHIFIDCDKIFNFIKNISTQDKENINIHTYNNKTYKFVCSNDIIDGQGVTICILSDITQSTIIQNQLKESEERYRNLMDILSDGVIIHNMNTISYINNKAIELFNLDENIKKVWLIDDIETKLTKKFKDEFLNNINLVQMSKKDKTVTKIETEEGKIIEFITTSITLNGNQMMLSLAIDITILENTMSELEQSEKTYKLLLQTIPEGIVIIDKKTRKHVYRNKAMIKLLKNIGNDKLNDIIKNHIETKEYSRFKKFTINNKDNNKENFDISIVAIDIKEDSNFLVVIRTLENQIKAQKMAEKLSEIKEKYKFKTEFLASVTKDIKKPINIIANTNNMLYINKDNYKSERIDNYTRLVKQNCHRLTRLLNNVEEIEEIENGKINMNLNKVDIIKLVKDIITISKTYTDEKRLSISFRSNMEKKIMIIDRHKIEKVILNILANSLKFTDTGGNIEVYISASFNEVKISVKDNGVGIPQDKIGVIFEDFEQVDRTLSRGAEGAGIGLSLAKKFVELHNGEIKVKSAIGKGSRFEIILKNEEYLESRKYNIDSYDDFIDKEKIDIEFSDIYLNLN